ncbi:MAG: flagellar basal body rod protein FlgB [candidate division Zixibacteria bacterium]
MDNGLSKFLFDKVGIPKVRTYLNLASLRHKLVSSNVANVATPGYRTRSIDFHKEFAKATSTSTHLAGASTNSGHMPLGEHKDRSPKIYQTKPIVGQLISVVIDREVTQLAENELMYTIAARLLQKKFDGIRNAITSR